MPRKRKTQTGYDAQGKPPVAGQVYGRGAEQQRLEQAMPTPNIQQGTTFAGHMAAQQAAQGRGMVDVAQAQAHAAGRAPANGSESWLAMQQAATQMKGRIGLMGADTMRPDEPITAGLSRGPGPGPEVLGMRGGTPVGDMLRRLSETTMDPFFATLAQRAGA